MSFWKATDNRCSTGTSVSESFLTELSICLIHPLFPPVPLREKHTQNRRLYNSQQQQHEFIFFPKSHRDWGRGLDGCLWPCCRDSRWDLTFNCLQTVSVNWGVKENAFYFGNKCFSLVSQAHCLTFSCRVSQCDCSETAAQVKVSSSQEQSDSTCDIVKSVLLLARVLFYQNISLVPAHRCECYITD